MPISNDTAPLAQFLAGQAVRRRNSWAPTPLYAADSPAGCSASGLLMLRPSP